MDNKVIYNYIKKALLCYCTIDLYDIEDLLDELGISLSEKEKDSFEDEMLQKVLKFKNKCEDYIIDDVVEIFKELLKEHLPKDN